MKPLHLLSFIPIAGFLIGVPFMNKIEPTVLGLPFSMFWIVLWVLLSSLTILIFYFADEKGRDEEVSE